VADASIDAVWSFDVFVHVAPLDQAGYLTEIARVLRPGGIAAIHHADGRNRGALPSRLGWRSPMSAGLFAALAEERGLAVRRQIRSWSEGRHDLSAFADVITVLERGA
jgi:SAM-dependent methyltransferase